MHTETEVSKQKVRKRKKRIRLGILIFLTITTLAGFITVHTPKFRAFVLSKIDQRLRKDYNLSLSAKSFNLNLFRLSASFEDLKISPLMPEESILQSFETQNLGINFSFKTLFGKHIHIQEFHVTKPEVLLSPTKNILPKTNKVSPNRTKPISFQIDKFLLDTGKIDYQFGPIILLGIGGTGVEIYRDTTVRMAPLHPRDTESMVKSLKARQLLEGYRGSKPVNLKELSRMLMAFSDLVTEIQDEIESVDLNPVLCTVEKCVVADARIILK